MNLAATKAPTTTTYAELQQAYDHFNRFLFSNKLPKCLITLQRGNRTYGYFSAQRWANLDGELTDQITLNPAYFAVIPIVETMQTLVHEMVHLWQYHYGRPGRGRYHNLQWARKIESLGLMPSSTGQPGGDRTGDHMADYAIEGGLFLRACERLLTAEFKISWYDRFPDEDHVEQGLASYANQLWNPIATATPAQSSAALANAVKPVFKLASNEINRSNRMKFVCPHCGQQAWGKPGLQLLCGKPACHAAPFTAEL